MNAPLGPSEVPLVGLNPTLRPGERPAAELGNVEKLVPALTSAKEPEGIITVLVTGPDVVFAIAKPPSGVANSFIEDCRSTSSSADFTSSITLVGALNSCSNS